ncbi:uncharacterized protein SCHCODRAFT_01106344 [Schizophyllum commune H4-8]|nr:uncharacterized protein SCHCODRAFT_01106344 [Schizophyllum commune H4-8]KAI5886072.1 hypothetical protein SCHCODRAFT_01106344 [Schizophyllum commune H4-8]
MTNAQSSLAVARYDTDALHGALKKLFRHPSLVTFLQSFTSIHHLTRAFDFETDIVVVPYNEQDDGTMGYKLRQELAEELAVTLHFIALLTFALLNNYSVHQQLERLPAFLTISAPPAGEVDNRIVKKTPSLNLALLYPNVFGLITTKTKEELATIYHRIQNVARYYTRGLLRLFEDAITNGFASAYNVGAPFGLNRATALDMVAPWVVTEEASRRQVPRDELLREQKDIGQLVDSTWVARALLVSADEDWRSAHTAIGLEPVYQIIDDRDWKDDTVASMAMTARSFVNVLTRDVNETVYSLA